MARCEWERRSKTSAAELEAEDRIWKPYHSITKRQYNFEWAWPQRVLQKWNLKMLSVIEHHSHSFRFFFHLLVVLLLSF